MAKLPNIPRNRSESGARAGQAQKQRTRNRIARRIAYASRRRNAS